MERAVDGFYLRRWEQRIIRAKQCLCLQIRNPSSQAGQGEIRTHITAKFGVLYSHSGCLKLMRRFGFEYRKPKALPHMADEAKQVPSVRFTKIC